MIKRPVRKNAVIATAVVAAIVGCVPILAAAQEADSLTGNWVGESRIDGKSTYLTFAFKIDKGALSGSVTAPFADNSEPQPFSSIKVANSHAELETASGPDAVKLDGNMRNGRIEGQIRRGNSMGNFEMVRLARIAARVLDDYVGDYQASNGRLIIIGRTLGSLYYFDPESGRTGPLLPSSESTFFGGPSIAIGFPLEVSVQFQRDANSRVVSVDFVLGVQPRLPARKVSLYTTEDVSFQNGDVTLSGSLKLPTTQGPHPAVVMLHGSNAQSRNGQDCIIGFNADYLARLGFAVLSYDKRGVGKSTGKREDIGLDGDASAAFAFLRGRKDIDVNRIGIWGISQGGMIAPQVAAQSNVAFIVNVSGAVVNGHQQEIERVELQMRADGFPENEIRDAVAFQTLKFKYARTGEGWDQYAEDYQRYKDRKWFPDPYIGPPESKDDPGFAVWRVGAGSLSPGDYWEKYKGPALYVVGEFETYSRPSSNIARFNQAMTKAGNTRYTVATIPKAEHGMREARTGGPKELPYLNRFAAEYFHTLKSWLQKNVLNVK